MKQNQSLLSWQDGLKHRIDIYQTWLLALVKKYWLRASLGIFIAYLFVLKDISINLSFQDANPGLEYEERIAAGEFETAAINTSLFTGEDKPVNYTPKGSSGAQPVSQSSTDPNLANTYSNMVYTEGDFATSESKTSLKSKRQKQQDYINKYASIAKREMEKYGIPASITLAQGLLESNAGDSRLALNNNNHFGVKCFSRTCKKGHCSNFTDDTHKDFFRKYNSVADSYRAHSLLLQAPRYRKLKKYGRKDYTNWAYGLKSAGYATDPHYAKKLINTIRQLKLTQYD